MTTGKGDRAPFPLFSDNLLTFATVNVTIVESTTRKGEAMRYTVTIELEASSREAARGTAEAAGFSVTKVSARRASRAREEASNVTSLTRADAHTDMPSGLSADEQAAYVRGYAKGCLTYTRKHGAPSITGTGAIDRIELRRLTRAHEWDRHPSAHRAGMRELNAYVSHPARASVVPAAVA